MSTDTNALPATDDAGTDASAEATAEREAFALPEAGESNDGVAYEYADADAATGILATLKEKATAWGASFRTHVDRKRQLGEWIAQFRLTLTDADGRPDVNGVSQAARTAMGDLLDTLIPDAAKHERDAQRQSIVRYSRLYLDKHLQEQAEHVLKAAKPDASADDVKKARAAAIAPWRKPRRESPKAGTGNADANVTVTLENVVDVLQGLTFSQRLESLASLASALYVDLRAYRAGNSAGFGDETGAITGYADKLVTLADGIGRVAHGSQVTRAKRQAIIDALVGVESDEVTETAETAETVEAAEAVAA